LDVTSTILQFQVAAALQVHGQIDVLINNAGFAIGGVIEDVDLDDGRRMFETNFWGMARLTQLLLPHMRGRGCGTIVNISSGSAVKRMQLIAFYSASKFAVEGFTEALSAEVEVFGI